MVAILLPVTMQHLLVVHRDYYGTGADRAGFTSTIQNPTNDTAWGTYQLIVTEKRNGCKDTAFKTVSFLDFGMLR